MSADDVGARALRDRIARSIGVPEKGPERIGRFVVTGRLGEGAMGQVFRAFDPDLDREIALKLLGNPEGPAQDRLVREAQAMARLGHPNVVAIHEVGRHDGSVYIAMELVGGGTLSDWLREGSRSPDQIITLFVQAGRGLAAAHEAGLVHRDFKPDNVLLGDDGRVRVADFGLARAADDSLYESVEGVDDELRDAKLARTLSRSGAISGTPRYMAPEQFAAKRVDARTDQFSFCVALWESLYGEPPFAGKTVAELAQSVTEGARRPTPRSPPLPPRVRRALERGLSVDPGERFASIAGLLTEIEPRASRRAPWIGAGVLLAAVGATWAALPDTRDPCPSSASRLDIWNDARREALSDAVAAVEMPGAKESAELLVDQMDAFARRWATVHRESCRAHKVEGELSDAGFDLAMACLGDARDEVDAFTVALAQPDRAMVLHALEASPPAVDRCRNVETLRKRHFPPPEDAEIDVAEIRAAMARARSMRDLGDGKGELAELDAALELAQKIEFEVMVAQIRSERGSALRAAGKAEEAVQELKRAALDAYRLGDDETAARAEIKRIFIEGNKVGELERALADLERAEAAAARADLDPHSLGVFNEQVGTILGMMGRLEDSLARFETARDLFEQTKDDKGLASVECNIGVSNARLRRIDEALAGFTACQQATLSLFGRTHPKSIDAMLNLGMVTAESGDTTAAREMLEQAQRASVDGGRGDHPNHALILEATGNTHDDDGNHAQAVGPLQRALEIREAALGENNPFVGVSCTNLANVLRRAGRVDEALPLYRRALSIFDDDRGAPRHRGDALFGLAQALIDTGEADEARTSIERARREFEKEQGTEGDLEACTKLLAFLDETEAAPHQPPSQTRPSTEIVHE